MAQKQRKFNCFIPLLLALVVLIGCIPPIQASAASSLTLSGVWRIKSGWEQAYDDDYFSDFSVRGSFFVYVDGVRRECSSLDFDGRYDSSCLLVDTINGSEAFFFSSGSHAADGGLIYFDSPVTTFDPSAVSFFTVYAERVESYTLIFDDRQVDHTHGYAWDAYLRFSSSSVSFECEECDWVYNYVYSGLGSLNGFTIHGALYNSSCHVPIDSSSVYVYPSVSTPDPVPDPDPGTTYSSTITIDGVKYTFTSTKENPVVSLQVDSGGVIMTYGDQEEYSLSSTSKTFLGLGYISGGAASFVPGETYSLAAGDHTLYMIYADTSTKFTLQSGQWQARFNSSTSTYYNLSSWPDGLASVPISFVSAGFAFNEMSYVPDGSEPGFLFYGSTPAYSFALSEWYGAHALVYFAVDQEVPEAFYKWFTANFTRTGDSMVSPVYSATINIYDNSGALLLGSFTFTDVSSLDVSLDMTGQTCVFRGNSLSSSWDPTSSMFSGFALSPGAAYPVFSSGFNYELPVDAFAGVPVTLNLYVTSGSTGSDDALEDIRTILSGFIATFVAPVMFFFSVQFIPGFSIGKLCLFAFCFGLLFWFLKVVR